MIFYVVYLFIEKHTYKGSLLLLHIVILFLTFVSCYAIKTKTRREYTLKDKCVCAYICKNSHLS